MTLNSTYNKTYQTLLRESEANPTAAPRALQGKELKDYLKGYRLGKVQRKLIVGSLLGDGSLTIPVGKHGVPRLVFEHTSDQFPYLWFKYWVFKDLGGRVPQLRKKPSTDGKLYQSYRWVSYRSSSFLFYFQQFYRMDALGQRRRQIPKLIHRWLTKEALSIWFQDDGMKVGPNTYVLNTQAYRLQDHRILQQALERNFGLGTSVHKNKGSYQLYICASSGARFRQLILPYMVSCMMYKI